MYKIGITGGIGSGKSTVCSFFAKLGIPVYYADDRAKLLLQQSNELRQGLVQAFGSKVYGEDGLLDRKHLAEIVFNDKQKLGILNNIVHPAVYEDSQQWQQEQEMTGVYYTLKEAALLYETGSYQALDKIIVVTAPEDVRINRVMARDNVEREAVLARMTKQMPQQKKVKLADYIITNLDRKSIQSQVLEIHYKVMGLADKT